MVGFMCYVSGKIDPSEFFFNLQLTFDGPPHLVQLKRGIEDRVMQDPGVVPDGSDYRVSDIEMLDLRLNMWVTVESRHQLYSGCHVTAIRDTFTATGAGLVDVTNKPLSQRSLGFATDAKNIFEALDVAGTGVLNLKSVLRVLRHDVNYAVDLFSALDKRATGAVTFQDFMTGFHERPKEFWRDVQTRINTGGKGRVTLQTEAGGSENDSSRRYDEQQQASYYTDPLAPGGMMADVSQTDPYGALKLADVRGGKGGGGHQQKHQQQGGAAGNNDNDGGAPGGPLPSIAIDNEATAALAGDRTGDASKDAASVEAARKVVDLLQSSVRRRREAKQKEQRLGQAVVSRLREQLRPPTAGQSGGGGGGQSSSGAMSTVSGGAASSRSGGGGGPSTPGQGAGAKKR